MSSEDEAERQHWMPVMMFWALRGHWTKHRSVSVLDITACAQEHFHISWLKLYRAQKDPIREQSPGVVSYLAVDVLLQTNSAVGGGAAAQRVGDPAAALARPFPFSLELPGLHLFQRLDGHPVHGALRREGRDEDTVNQSRWTRKLRRIYTRADSGFPDTFLTSGCTNVCLVSATQRVGKPWLQLSFQFVSCCPETS